MQHLNLSVNSVARATKLPPEKLLTLFGKPDHEARSYDALAAMYRHGLEWGIRAEDIPKFMPNLPQDQTHLREDLLAAWSDANQQLLAAMGDWSETQLDQSCIGHPALGLLCNLRPFRHEMAVHPVCYPAPGRWPVSQAGW